MKLGGHPVAPGPLKTCMSRQGYIINLSWPLLQLWRISLALEEWHVATVSLLMHTELAKRNSGTSCDNSGEASHPEAKHRNIVVDEFVLLANALEILSRCVAQVCESEPTCRFTLAIAVQAVTPFAHAQAFLAKAGCQSSLVTDPGRMASAARDPLNTIARLDVNGARWVPAETFIAIATSR